MPYEDEGGELPLARRWLELLSERWESSIYAKEPRRGLEALEGTEASARQAMSRMLGGGKRDETAGLAWRFRRALAKIGVDMPPPYAAIEDDEDCEWLELGRYVRKATPADFAKLQQILRSFKDAAESRDRAASLVEEIVGKTTK